MDCEKIESVIVDELYGELDEVTSAAVRRHAAGCARCAKLLGGLRATREVAILPFVDPPADLERRILLAANAGLGPEFVSRGHLARAVSVAGSWAMRPQTAMAAVFLVMLGSAVLLLRGRSSRAPANAEMIVTEKGTPAPAPTEPPEPGAAAAAAPPTANLPAAEAKRANAAPPTPVRPEAREREFAKQSAFAAKPDGTSPASPGRGQNLEEAIALKAAPAGNAGAAAPPAAFAPAPAAAAARAASTPPAADDQASAASTPSGLNAALTEARAQRDAQGCRAAVAHFDDVARRAAGSAPGWDALLESARCYRLLGDYPSARARLTTLLKVAQFKDRARAELNQLDQAQAPASAPP
jgi:hypothetical protein